MGKPFLGGGERKQGGLRGKLARIYGHRRGASTSHAGAPGNGLALKTGQKIRQPAPLGSESPEDLLTVEGPDQAWRRRHFAKPRRPAAAAAIA